MQKGLLALALLAVVAFLPRLVSRIRRGGAYSVATLQNAMENERHLILLDVRSEEEFFGHQGHIAGAINVPLEELNRRSIELAEYSEWKLAVIDSGEGKAAGKAVQTLAAHGYADSHPVSGGMVAWHEAGFPVVR